MNDDVLADLRDLLEEAAVRRYRMALTLRDGTRLAGRVRLTDERFRVGDDPREIELAEVLRAEWESSRSGRCG